MKELFSQKAKKVITAVSLSCFLCSPISYVFSMEQASAAALDTKIAYENQLNTVGFDKDDHWNRGRSDKDKDWKKPPAPKDDDKWNKEDKRPPAIKDKDEDKWNRPDEKDKNPPPPKDDDHWKDRKDDNDDKDYDKGDHVSWCNSYRT